MNWSCSTFCFVCFVHISLSHDFLLLLWANHQRFSVHLHHTDMNLHSPRGLSVVMRWKLHWKQWKSYGGKINALVMYSSVWGGLGKQHLWFINYKWTCLAQLQQVNPSLCTKAYSQGLKWAGTSVGAEIGTKWRSTWDSTNIENVFIGENCLLNCFTVFLKYGRPMSLCSGNRTIQTNCEERKEHFQVYFKTEEKMCYSFFLFYFFVAR